MRSDNRKRNRLHRRLDSRKPVAVERSLSYEGEHQDGSSPFSSRSDGERAPRVARSAKPGRAPRSWSNTCQGKSPYLFGVCGHGNIGLSRARPTPAPHPTIRCTTSSAGYMAMHYKVRHEPWRPSTSCVRDRAISGRACRAMMDSSAFLRSPATCTTQFNRIRSGTGRYFQGISPRHPPL